MELTRRQLLELGAASAAALVLPVRGGGAARAALPAGLTRFTEPLPTLADLGVLDMRGGGSATVRLVSASHRFHSSLGAAATFAYRGGDTGDQTYLGPVIVAQSGVPFDLTAVNELGPHPLANSVDTDLDGATAEDRTAPRAAVHLHGGNVAPGSDGGPLDTFRPGASYTYHYGNTQEAAGLWYHDHAFGITRLNVYAGLASGYLVRDDDDPGDGSRLPGPPYEIPLVLQDRMLGADGSLVYPPNPNPSTPRPWAPEFFGDVPTVNGKAWPTLEVDRGLYRFRVYNGSNSRFYGLRFVATGPLPVRQIGTDGGLLDAAVPLQYLLLGPGERADLVVDFSRLLPGATVLLTNDAATPFPSGPRAERRGGVPLPQLMRFTVGSNIGYTQPLPAPLRSTPITRLGGVPVARTRTMTLVEVLDADDAPLTALLNNREFISDDYASIPVQNDTVEIWELVNTTGDAHPIHLHLVQFQVLNRQRFDVPGYLAAAYGSGPVEVGTGPYPPPPVTSFLRGAARPPARNEAGWKDTVVAMPGEVTRLLVPFGAGAAGDAPLAFSGSFTGTYVWHCHILEHEDNEMMQRYLVV